MKLPLISPEKRRIVAVAALGRRLVHRDAGFNQPPGLADPLEPDVVPRRVAGSLLENPPKLGAADIKPGGNLIHGQVFIDVVVDIPHNPGRQGNRLGRGIDAVAREGMRFNQFYTEPVCSPSRSCLMTGQNPVRTGITNYLEANNSTYLHPEEFEALPKMLGRAGYETAILGKWHLSGGYQDYPELGPGIPAEHGFDQVIMSEQRYIGPGYYYYPYWHLPQVTDGTPGEYLVDHMNRKAVEYLEERADSDQPFFLYFSHYATHTTLEAPQETVDYFQAKRGESAGRGTQDRNPYLAAMLKHVDDGVGMIDQKLKELGMYDNTILVIASDNGGDLAVTDNGELRGGKTDLYEGGIRDPLLIRWPEKMQGGQETDFPTHMIDFYQTFGEAAGLPPEEIPENSGISLMPLLSGAGVPDRDTLYWVMLRDTTLTPGFTVDYDTIFREGGAIRKGDYKYLESFAHDRRELYNLAEDPGEHNNLIDRYPEIAQALSRELHSLFERDTYGKTFQTGFEGDEYYLWSNSGAFTYANGSFSSSGASGGAVALQMYLYYDAKVQVDGTAPETGRAGLQFRSSLAKPTNPAFKAYAAVLDAEKGRVELLNVKGQNASVLAAADLELTPGAQYRLRVETDSDQIQIYVDDELALTCFDQTYLKGGIGLYADGAVTTFDNLTATGVEGMRPVSDRQLGFAPPHDIKVKADGSYIWPDVEPVRQEEEILFDAEAFLTALGGQVDFDPVTGTSTTRFQGLEASYTLGSTQAIAGGETVTLAAAPTVIAGRIHVPLSFLLEALRLDYTAEGDTVDCSSSLETEIRHTETDKITYTGAWITGGEAGDATRSKVKGETAELAFQGTGVRLYVSNGTGAGLCNIYIDDQLADTVDTYSPTTGSDVLAFQKTGLPDGSHTIRVENAGPGQSGSSANINLHRLVVMDNPGAEPSFTPGEVSDRIAALPESLGDTLDSRPAIRAAAAALASLPAEQQAQVDGREKLTALSEAAAAFEAPPAAINLLLGSLPAPVQVTRAQQDDIAALQADYTALNPEQKLLVVQAKKLTRLQAALDSLLKQTGALQALYDSYADMAQGDYTDTSWAELQAALLEAGAVLASDTATLADADAAITRLSQAAEGLEIQTSQPDGRLEAALKAAGAAVNALAVSNKTTGDDVLTAAREAVDDDIQITCLAVL